MALTDHGSYEMTERGEMNIKVRTTRSDVVTNSVFVSYVIYA